MRTALAVTIALLVALSCALAQEARPRKKLIETGWDSLTTDRLRANLAEVESRPFQGVIFEAVGKKPDGKPQGMRPTFSNEKWERAWFQNCVDDLLACKFKRLTDNFVTVGANPGNVDWFDDAGWANVVEHWRIAAWIAKQGKVRGILFDPEAYTEPFVQFRYSAQPQHDQHTFAEYAAKARQRGRAVMQAVGQEYPDIVLFTYFMNMVNTTALGQSEASAALANSGYGLYPAFVDGWLDAAPPTVTLVDGCEMSYLYNSVQPFLESALLIKGDCQTLVSPENRAKYRAQVQVGFGIYLDAYVNPKGSPWYIDDKGATRLERLRQNVNTALRVADQYVWIYGEKSRWWPTPNTSLKTTWEEALPGCEAALGFAGDPLTYGRARLAEMEKAGKLVELARNGDFGSDKAPVVGGGAADWKQGGAPAGWSTWQEDSSKGTFTWDREIGHLAKGSAKAAGVGSGCFIQSYDVKPGERYAIRVFSRQEGKGVVWVRVRWQTAEGKWTAEEQDKLFYRTGPAGDWQETFGVVEVPESAGKLIILLSAAGQSTPQDAAWFDDVHVNKVD